MADLQLDEYVISVPGEPVPWAQKQTNPKGGNGRFVPAKQSKHAGLIMDAWERAHGSKGIFLPKGKPIRLAGEFWCCRPQSQYGSGANAKQPKSTQYASPAKLYPTGKPDLSNLLKMVEDALTSVVWADDDQVCDLTGSKRLIHPWEPPRSVIRITPLPFENLWDYEQHKRQLDLAASL